MTTKTMIFILCFCNFIAVFVIGFLLAYSSYEHKRAENLQVRCENQDELIQIYKDKLDEKERLITELARE